MTDRDDWLTGQDLGDRGFEIRPASERAVRVHGRKETPEHLVTKALLALALQRSGRAWDTEVVTESGDQVDVLDFGPADGDAVVYEAQSNATPAEAKAKADQYAGGPVRDVVVVDPVELLPDLDPALEMVDSMVLGGGLP